MNERLQRLINWAGTNGVSLNEVDIDVGSLRIVFWQRRHTRKEFQSVKKAIGMFERTGEPPNIRLKKNLYVEYMADGENLIDDWNLEWYGAYECKSLGYDCGPADFKEAPEDSIEAGSEVPDSVVDAAVEDNQLERAGTPPF